LSGAYSPCPLNEHPHITSLLGIMTIYTDISKNPYM